MNRSACLLLIAALGLQAGPAAAEKVIAGLARVRDGDSLDIGRSRVRLWGVDAPEYAQTCTRNGQPWACGSAAREALSARIDGRRVRCETVTRDAYRRHVARCSVDGRSLNEWLVREGWALDYAQYSDGRYAAAQAEAKRRRRGIWVGTFESPARYRQRHRER